MVIEHETVDCSIIRESKAILGYNIGVQRVQYSSHKLACKQAPSEVRKKNRRAKRVGVRASAHVSNQRYDENVAKNCSKLLQICALHAEATVDGLGKNYANLQTVVKICQLYISELLTVIDSTNQILIPGAGIMERRHQWNVYRLPCALPPHQNALGSSRSP